jgi:hypothetical protein
MALAYSRDRVTRDLDAVFEPKREIYDEAAQMANDLGLPENWLNDAVKGLLPEQVKPIEGTGSFSTRGLRVGVASAEYLFAMKVVMRGSLRQVGRDCVRCGRASGPRLRP